MPRNIHEFMDFYGVKHTKTKAILFKAVHKKNGEYVSNYRNSFKYLVGKTIKEICDLDINCECSNGIHVSHLAWAVNFGRGWPDLAILEVETKIADIIMPLNTNGKVRTSSAMVIREVPLEECGLTGKMLARRRGK